MARMNRPAPVEVSYKNMRFLITHNPTNATLSTFIQVSGPAGTQQTGHTALSLLREICHSQLKFCTCGQKWRPGYRIPEEGTRE